MPRRLGGLTACVLIAGSVGVPAAVAAFVDADAGASSTFGAAPDWVAPQVGSTVIAKTTGYLAGSIKQGGTYYVYANVTDTGSPSSGIALESADVSAVTPAGTAVPLLAGPYSVGGVSYGHRSAALTASTPLAAGTRSYSIASTDGAGNTRTQTGYGVSVDNPAPGASNVQTTNRSGAPSGEPRPATASPSRTRSRSTRSRSTRAGRARPRPSSCGSSTAAAS